MGSSDAKRELVNMLIKVLADSDEHSTFCDCTTDKVLVERAENEIGELLMNMQDKVCFKTFYAELAAKMFLFIRLTGKSREKLETDTLMFSRINRARLIAAADRINKRLEENDKASNH